MEFKIIQATPDHQQLEDLILVLESYMEDPMGVSASFSREMRKRLKQDLSCMEHLVLFLGYCGPHIAGAVVCFTIYSTFLAAPAINIHDLAVIPRFRGKGLGRLLLGAVEKYARAHQMGRITLEVRCDNIIAQKLYQSCGFHEGDHSMYFWKKVLLP
jgi:ribosomal protein S18 acetylase RimI-like enzyme